MGDAMSWENSPDYGSKPPTRIGLIVTVLALVFIACCIAWFSGDFR
jgi:hypothetical protein